MRILIGGIVWESLTFSPVKASKDDYSYYRGQDLLDYFELGSVLEELNIEPVTTVYARCNAPGGWSNKEAFLSVRDEILEGIRNTEPLDGICLILHGANQVDGGIGCAEEALILAIRELVGPDMLIAGRYDQHANITELSAEALNIITVFRTAPHRDTITRYHDTLRILAKAVTEGLTPRSTAIRLPILVMGEKSTNVTEPMRSLIAQAVEASSEPGILNADIAVGYCWTDVPIAGMVSAVTAVSEADLPKAVEVRNRLARAVWQRRFDFEICGEYAPDIDSGIRTALEAPEPSIFLTDTGDNISAGTPGDTTGFLRRLLELKVPDAVLAAITDSAATQACFDAGLFATVTLSVGGKLDCVNSGPLEVTGKVINLYTPPPGSLQDVRSASIQVEGVKLVLTDVPWAYVTLKQFTTAGINPLEHKIVVTKVGYLHPEMVDIAPRGIMVITPGYSPLDLTTLHYENVIRPIFPLDEFEWDPEEV